MKYTVRDLAYIGVFAACWGAVEITLGALLHALQVPFGGVLLAGAGVSLACVGRLYVPKRGSVFLIALVAALLKMLSVGGIVLSPMVAIAAEGLVAELALVAIGPSRVGFIAAGAAACLWPLAHAVLSLWMRGGAGLISSYQAIIARGAGVLKLPGSAGWTIVAVLIAVHVAVGVAAGWLAWSAGQGLRRRGRDFAGERGRA